MVCDTLNLSNQLSKLFQTLRSGKTKFQEFRRLFLQHFFYSRLKIVKIPTIFTCKHVKFLEIILETMILGYSHIHVSLADFGLKK